MAEIFCGVSEGKRYGLSTSFSSKNGEDTVECWSPYGNETWKFTSNENVVEATGFYGIDVRSDDRFMVGSARFARSRVGCKL